MKRSFIILTLILCVMTAVQAQDARDLYLGYSGPTNTTANTKKGGRPGTKVTIERFRNGKIKFVSPKSKFRSGDKIRLRFATNFDGYIRILNIGSSGRINMLFPYKGANDRITPSFNFQIPNNNDWIVFDETEGTEMLSVIMSSKPFNRDDDDLRSLNNRSTRSRDLSIQMDEDATFAVTTQESLDKRVGFTLRLKHRSGKRTVEQLSRALKSAFEQKDFDGLGNDNRYGPIKVVIENSLADDDDPDRFENNQFNTFKKFEKWLPKMVNRISGALNGCKQGTCTYQEIGLLHNTWVLRRFTYGYRKGRPYIKTIYILDGN